MLLISNFMESQTDYEFMDVMLTPLTDLGRYASLTYGISQVVGDQP
jgi:hypothetical protein